MSTDRRAERVADLLRARAAWHVRRLAGVVVASAVATLAAATAPAQPPSLAVSDSLEFRVLGLGSGRELRFTVDAPKAVHRFSVAVRDVRNPDGTQGARGAVTAQADSVVRPDPGAQVRLTLDPAAFATPGTYAITLRLSGAAAGGTVVARSVTVRVTRPAPVLGVAPLIDRLFRLSRGWPWTSASRVDTLQVPNVGRTDVTQLRVTPLEVLARDTNADARGAVRVRRLDAADHPPRAEAAGTSAVPLAPGEQVPVEITFRAFKDAGEYRTGFRLQSPALDTGIRVPMRVQVSDGALAPLTVVALGVLLAYLSRRFTERWRPAQENRYRLAELVEVTRQWRPLVSPQVEQQLATIRENLRAAERQNELGRTADAKTKLDDVAKALENISAAEHKRRTSAWSSLGALRARLEGVSAQQGNLSNQDCIELAALTPRLGNAESALAAGRAFAAEEQLSEIAKALDKLEAALAQAAGPGALTAPGVQRAAAPGEITVAEPKDVLNAGTDVDFTVDDPSAQMRPNDVLVWDFGDGMPEVATPLPSPKPGGPQQPAPRQSHRYEDPGEYLVKLSVRRGGSEIARAYRSIVVRAPRIDGSLARLTGWLWRVDAALSFVALMVAVAVGYFAVYQGKLFGSGADYLAAFLWGFGVDSSLKTAAEVLKKLKE